MQECERQHNQIVEIHSLLAHLPNIMSQLHSMLATIGKYPIESKSLQSSLVDEDCSSLQSLFYLDFTFYSFY